MTYVSYAHAASALLIDREPTEAACIELASAAVLMSSDNVFKGFQIIPSINMKTAWTKCYIRFQARVVYKMELTR
ncbi:MAG: hypothetical protein LZ167_04255 [Thaumarchaeota archaeon]|jgi:hypothetical protein|nr:hypothetical protein [Candidatus Geocrenenecus arthurdayi]